MQSLPESLQDTEPSPSYNPEIYEAIKSFDKCSKISEKKILFDFGEIHNPNLNSISAKIFELNLVAFGLLSFPS